MVQITKTSQLSGKRHTLEIPVDAEKLNRWLLGEDPRLVQEIFPELTPEQQDFLLTGIIPEERGTVLAPDDCD